MLKLVQIQLKKTEFKRKRRNAQQHFHKQQEERIYLFKILIISRNNHISNRRQDSSLQRVQMPKKCQQIKTLAFSDTETGRSACSTLPMIKL